MHVGYLTSTSRCGSTIPHLPSCLLFSGVTSSEVQGVIHPPEWSWSFPIWTRTLNYLQSACGYWRHHVLLNHPNCLRNHRRCGPPAPATNLKPPSHWINGSTWKLEKFVQLTNRVKCELAIKKRFSSRPRSKSPATKQNAYLARPESGIDHILWYKYNTVCSKFTFTELPKFCGVTIQFACSKAFRLKASNLDITSQKALWQVLTRVDKVDIAHALHCICTINPCALSIACLTTVLLRLKRLQQIATKLLELLSNQRSNGCRTMKLWFPGKGFSWNLHQFICHCLVDGIFRQVCSHQKNISKEPKETNIYPKRMKNLPFF